MHMLRSCDPIEVHEGTFAVNAAGAIIWRITAGELEVLMIHRDRYDDWSWPKGKIDAGETMPECAVREVFEEVGLDIELGIPLPAMTYMVGAGPKVVYYWAAKAPDHQGSPGRQGNRRGAFTHSASPA